MPEETQVTKPRLWDLADQIAALMDTDEAGVPLAEEPGFALAVREALLASRDKVDAYNSLLGQIVMNAAVADAVADHHAEQSRAARDRGSRLRGAAERIKNYVLDAIRVLGVDPKSKTYRKLEGSACTFQANRVGASCEVYDEMLVPDKYKRVTLSISFPVPSYKHWRQSNGSIKLDSPDWKADFTTVKALILADLKKPCERCAGSGFLTNGLMVDLTELCPACAGKRTQQISGARLVDNKLSLVVK